MSTKVCKNCGSYRIKSSADIGGLAMSNYGFCELHKSLLISGILVLRYVCEVTIPVKISDKSNYKLYQKYGITFPELIIIAILFVLVITTCVLVLHH